MEQGYLSEMMKRVAREAYSMYDTGSLGTSATTYVTDRSGNEVPYIIPTPFNKPVKLVFEKNPCGEYLIGAHTEYMARWEENFNMTSMSQDLIKQLTQQQTAWNAIDRQIDRVIFNEPATIILWKDGTKTVVKTQDGEPFDEEKGFLMAVAKYLNKGKGSYFNLIKKHCY